MKRNVILLCSLLLLFTFQACGKKGNPVPLGRAVPAGISDFSGQVKDGVLFLSFSVPQKNQDGTPITDLGGFKVYKNCNTCIGAFELFKDVRLDEEKGYTIVGGKLYIFDEDLADGYKYIYQVYPYTTKGTRGNASNALAVTWKKPPAPPSGVKAIGSDGMIELSWTPEKGYYYNVYRLEGTTYPLFALNDKPVTVTLFTDAGLENGKKYIYEVRKTIREEGVWREGEGVRAEAVPADNLPPPAPHSVRAVKAPQGGVTVSWEAEAPEDILGFNLYRIVGEQKEKLNKDPLKEEVFFDRLVPNVRYVAYYVTAIDMSGNESDPSREAVILLRKE